ncbi:MAG: calcium-binding protein, partial [Pseudomonadota bacterium]
MADTDQKTGAVQAADATLSAPAANDTVLIEKPAEGEQVAVRVAGKKAVFDFDLADVEIELVDVDIILRFPDGAKIILLEAGLDFVTDESIVLSFNDGIVSAQALLAKVGEVKASEIVEVEFSSEEDEGGNTADDPEKENVKVVEIVEVVVEDVAPKSAELDAVDENPGDSEAVQERSNVEENLAQQNNKFKTTEEAAAPSTDTESSVFDLGVSDIDIRLFGITEQTTTALDTGGVQIFGATAIEPADVDPSFGAQFATETIAGTDQSDLIYADSPVLAPTGTSARVFEITVSIPFEGFTPTSATITGLPDGWSVLNADAGGDGLTFAADPDNPFVLSAQIVYELADTQGDPDPNGFFETTTFSLTYDVVDANGNVGTTTASAQISQREVRSAEDTIFQDFLTGEDVVVLAVNPPGNNISAGGGDDTIIGAVGVDFVDGGAGSDFLGYETSNAAVTIDLGAGSASGGYAEGDTFTGIENLLGSTFDDALTGDAGDNILIGLAGADRLDGAGGSDTASYAGSAEAVTLNLGSGIFLGGDAQGDTLFNIENLTGSSFADTLIGDAGANRLSGADGDDTLVGAAGADTLDGGAGRDVADYSGAGAAVGVDMTGGPGFAGEATGDVILNVEDVIGSAFGDTVFGGAEDNLLRGEGGADLLRGGDGADTVEGGEGDDTIGGGFGADVLSGGAGVDTADFGDLDTAVDASLATRTASAAGNVDTLQGVENLTGTRFADTLEGDGAANLLTGAEGSDTLTGGAGADTLDGGAGDDLVDYGQSLAAVLVDLVAQTASGGDADGDVILSIEGVSGSDFADTLLGDAGDNLLLGQGGDDVLLGAAGADTIDGGDGVDTIDFETSAAAVTINLALEFGQGGDAEGDVFTAIENVVGTNFDDQLIGDTANNRLEGLAGDDTLEGGVGADTLFGGAGFDFADYAGAGTSVVIDLSSGTGAGGDANGDVLLDIEGLRGSAFADTLVGGVAANIISGAGGADRLAGGGGAD